MTITHRFITWCDINTINESDIKQAVVNSFINQKALLDKEFELEKYIAALSKYCSKLGIAIEF